jgi:putative glutamine amidotransferase
MRGEALKRDPEPVVAKVGVTQRQAFFVDRDELRDELDVRLGQLLWAVGLAPVPLVNAVATSFEEAVAYLDALALDAVVLSGGDEVGEPPARDCMERAALYVAKRDGLPLLGICRGLQVMNVLHGGRLEEREGHVAVRRPVDGPTLARRDVACFHTLAIPADGVAPGFRPFAWAEDGTVEAVNHESLPWMGLMWHPERTVPFDGEDVALVAAALNRTRRT